MKRLIIVAGLLTATLTGNAQTEVVSGQMNGKDYGVSYNLPKTEIEVQIKTVYKKYTPGEFAKYANKYLRINDMPAEAEERYEIESISASSVGVPDKDNTYFVKMKDKTVAPLLELTPDGIIKSINMPKSEEKAAAVTAEAEKREVDPRTFLTEEILMTSSTAKMAELVAKEIYSIRESRNALLRGQADNTPKDGEQLKLMIESLNEQERAMTEMFIGKTEKKEKVFTARIQPSEMQNNVAIRFSQKLGAVASNDLSGEPVYITIANLNSVEKPAEGTKKKLDGVAYNVPGKANVTLTYKGEKVFNQELYVTQFGVVEYLASVLFNKTSTIKVSFDPNTGRLLKIDRE